MGVVLIGNAGDRILSEPDIAPFLAFLQPGGVEARPIWRHAQLCFTLFRIALLPDNPSAPPFPRRAGQRCLDSHPIRSIHTFRPDLC